MMPMIAFGLLEATAAGGVVGLAAAAGVAAAAAVAGAGVGAAPVVGGDVGATAVVGLQAASRPDAATRAPRRRRTARRPMRNSALIAAVPSSENVPICYPPGDEARARFGYRGGRRRAGRVAPGSSCRPGAAAVACVVPVGAGRPAGADGRSDARNAHGGLFRR